MTHPRQVANAPSKPVMVYDGDCRFCMLWVRRWMQVTGEAVDCVPLQDGRVALLYPELPQERLERAVHLIDTDGAVYQGAEAVFRSLAVNRSRRWALRLYQSSPWVARATEACYRFVAGHRSLFGSLTRLCWGQHVERAELFLVRRVFLGWLGVIYLIAFVSLWTQVAGLIGKDGVLPASHLMLQARSAVAESGIGIDRYRLLPTLCWLGASDGFLRFQCAAGATLALLVIVGICPRVCLALEWLLYLSLATVSRDFLAFQWDNLLLETGLLAIFLAPGRMLPRPSLEKPASRTVLWLLRLLLFKLMFLSGVVKLASGDGTWRGLSALTYHYETQPLPTWIAWYAYQPPLWFQKGSCAVMFLIELAVPFLIFAPRRLRMAGGAVLALFQVLILLTGNYTFFNWLTLGLCLLLLDDFAMAGLVPRKLSALYSRSRAVADGSRNGRRRWQGVGMASLAVVVVGISAVQLLSPFGRLPSWTSPALAAHRWLAPFRSVNSYGLFAVMTTERPEIIVEGSNDGHGWQAYEFPYKPGDPKRRPAFVAPHQPRLDWQMWFAALGDVRQNPWFVNFCVRLLQGSPDVLALLEKNPFPDRPPKYIRARVYNYQFTSPGERRRTGAWWKRELKGGYLPSISLEMLKTPPS
ncbi:MAG: lipase maturation factor family protein [Limisphaerales bacterium]